MLPSHILLSLFFVTLTAVDAGPAKRGTTGTLSLSTRVHRGGIQHIVERDRARMQSIKQGSHSGTSSIGDMNIGSGITVDVGIGDPPTTYTLLVDTSSANTWVGANKAYVKTKTSHDTGLRFSISYPISDYDGAAVGEVWNDDVKLSDELVIRQQSIGGASWTTGFYDIDGVLGVGPVDLSIGTVGGVETVPTVMDNLYTQRKISQEVLAILLVPRCKGEIAGELTFGGYDENVPQSKIVYTPVTTSKNASRYWGIDQWITYGADTILGPTSGIIDPNTDMILLSTEAFNAYKNKTGAIIDLTSGFLTITLEQYSNLEPLTFWISNKPFPLHPNAQIIRRNSINDTTIYLVIWDIAQYDLPPGIDFVFGIGFLQYYYSVYDTTNHRVGFSNTNYSRVECN